MKIIKQLSLLLISIVLVLGVCGCVKKDKIQTDDIILKLENKYNDTFTLLSSGNELWTEDYSELIFISDKLNDEVVVWVYPNGEILDNYIAIKYKEDVQKLVTPLANKVYKNSKVVNIPIHYGKKHFNAEMSLFEYVASKQSSVSVFIATDKDSNSAETDVANLSLLFKENGIIANIKVFYYNENEFLELEETNDPTTVFSPLSNKRLSATMNADYSINSLDWSE